MKDSSPMNETRYQVIKRDLISPKNTGKNTSIEEMIDTFRLIYHDPQPMIDERKRDV